MLGNDFAADFMAPTSSNVLWSLGTAVAGPGIEFNYFGALPIDLSDDQITFTFLMAPSISNVAFAGFRIRDVDGSAQITGVSLASVTNLPGFDAGNISLSGDDIFVNFTDNGIGLVATGLPTIILNVATAVSVPEPAALGLFAAGLGLLWRKRRNG